MSSIILHHFDASPFSEKVRVILGYKQIAWQSVQIPRILPKPDLMPLTGGYRKTPVMQIGRDIYCDTHLIGRIIDRLVPERPVVPADAAASMRAIEEMADRQLFLAAIPLMFRPAGLRFLREKLGEEYLERFQADRAELFSQGSVSRPDDVYSDALWAPAMTDLDAQLAQNDFLLGDAPTLADFAVYNPVWYVRANEGIAATLDVYPRLMAWFERMRAFGHGEPSELEPAGALRIAADCEDWQALEGSFDDTLGFNAGQTVSVHARDYGVDAVTGRLVHLNALSVTIEREAEDLGPVRVHFPRVGFDIETSN